MMNKNIIILSIIALGAFLWWSNSQKVASLKAQLNAYQSNPPTSRTDNKWINIIQTMLGLGMNIYAQFKPGGMFYQGSNSLSEQDINIIYQKIQSGDV